MLKYTGKRIFIGILSLFVLVTAAFSDPPDAGKPVSKRKCVR